MSKIRVAVLRGGPSSEYDVSLLTGNTILKNLSEQYHPIDVLISRDGVWHVDGLPREPHSVLSHSDVVVNALHGEYGEDGKVQQLLHHHNIPYTGSDPLGSALGMHKLLAKKIYAQAGIKTPYHIPIERPGNIHEYAVHLHKTFPNPRVVKPVGAGSSVGVTVARNVMELEIGLAKIFDMRVDAFLEEYIGGKEASCGVIDDFRGQGAYSLIPVEVRAKGSHFFDYNSKYAAEAHEIICPGNFTREESHAIQHAAKLAHKALGLRHYSRSDFMVHPRRGIYILETNTLPGMTEESLFPKALHAIGCKLSDFLDHLIGLAMGRK
ncbi:MAG TPA: D-alanine--D-alanine ligase [Candidatus Paceibacterota bacterium]